MQEDGRYNERSMVFEFEDMSAQGVHLLELAER